MSANNGNKVLIGDCDCCTKEQVKLVIVRDMKMCADCLLKETTAQEQAVAANVILQESKVVDASIEIKVDVFRAATTAAMELKGAIDNDPNIPDAEKDFVMAQQSLDRFKSLQKAIFEKRQELNEKENEMRAWQTQVHEFAGKLRKDRQEAFRNFDISYQPKPVKITKATTKDKTPKSVLKAEIREMATKYNVEAYLVTIMVNKGMTPRLAAEHVAEKFNKATK